MANLLQKLKLDYRIRAGYGLAFLLLLVSYILTWYANQQVITQSKYVIKTNELLDHLEDLASYMKDAETGARGYLITKNRSLLEPYFSSEKNVSTTFDLLKKETFENADQQIRLYLVKGLIDEKYNVMTSEINSFEGANFVLTDSIMNKSFIGKILMDSIRLEIGIMKINEQRSLDERVKELHDRYTSMDVIIVTSLVLALLFAVLGLITYKRENNARKIGDKRITAYQEQLKNQIEELDIANKELIQMRRTEQFAATGRIARTIAHEVRNPLTNIDLAIGQLKSELKENDESTNMLFEMINRNSRRINQLITDLLNATRFEDLNYHFISINYLLDEALELAKDRIELNHIEVQKKYDRNIGDISADPDKLKIAFLNIIVNAVEAMENDKGTLKITTSKVDNKCVVEIKDNGIGMNDASLAKLFEPYYTTKTKGNGLGLTNTQNIILNHKGTIHVESEPGEGTLFVVKFDLADKNGSS